MTVLTELDEAVALCHCGCQSPPPARGIAWLSDMSNWIYIERPSSAPGWAYHLCEKLKGQHRNAKDQLLPASQAIPLNIAEGNGKATEGDRRRFFEIARGSALECGAVQDVLEVCGALSSWANADAKRLLDRIVAMLTRLGQRVVPTARDP